MPPTAGRAPERDPLADVAQIDWDDVQSDPESPPPIPRPKKDSQKIRCHLCGIECTGRQAMDAHKRGAKHKRNQRQQRWRTHNQEISNHNVAASITVTKPKPITRPPDPPPQKLKRRVEKKKVDKPPVQRERVERTPEVVPDPFAVPDGFDDDPFALPDDGDDPFAANDAEDPFARAPPVEKKNTEEPLMEIAPVRRHQQQGTSERQEHVSTKSTVEKPASAEKASAPLKTPQVDKMPPKQTTKNSQTRKPDGVDPMEIDEPVNEVADVAKGVAGMVVDTAKPKRQEIAGAVRDATAGLKNVNMDATSQPVVSNEKLVVKLVSPRKALDTALDKQKVAKELGDGRNVRQEGTNGIKHVPSDKNDVAVGTERIGTVQAHPTSRGNGTESPAFNSRNRLPASSGKEGTAKTKSNRSSDPKDGKERPNTGPVASTNSTMLQNISTMVREPNAAPAGLRGEKRTSIRPTARARPFVKTGPKTLGDSSPFTVRVRKLNPTPKVQSTTPSNQGSLEPGLPSTPNTNDNVREANRSLSGLNQQQNVTRGGVQPIAQQPSSHRLAPLPLPQTKAKSTPPERVAIVSPTKKQKNTGEKRDSPNLADKISIRKSHESGTVAIGIDTSTSESLPPRQRPNRMINSSSSPPKQAVVHKKSSGQGQKKSHCPNVRRRSSPPSPMPRENDHARRLDSKQNHSGRNPDDILSPRTAMDGVSRREPNFRRTSVNNSPTLRTKVGTSGGQESPRAQNRLQDSRTKIASRFHSPPQSNQNKESSRDVRRIDKSRTASRRNEPRGATDGVDRDSPPQQSSRRRRSITPPRISGRKRSISPSRRRRRSTSPRDSQRRRSHSPRESSRRRSLHGPSRSPPRGSKRRSISPRRNTRRLSRSPPRVSRRRMSPSPPRSSRRRSPSPPRGSTRRRSLSPPRRDTRRDASPPQNSQRWRSSSPSRGGSRRKEVRRNDDAEGSSRSVRREQTRDRERSDYARGGSYREDVRGGSHREDARGGPHREDARGGPHREDVRGGSHREDARGGPHREDARAREYARSWPTSPPSPTASGKKPRETSRGRNGERGRGGGRREESRRPEVAHNARDQQGARSMSNANLPSHRGGIPRNNIRSVPAPTTAAGSYGSRADAPGSPGKRSRAEAGLEDRNKQAKRRSYDGGRSSAQAGSSQTNRQNASSGQVNPPSRQEGNGRGRGGHGGFGPGRGNGTGYAASDVMFKRYGYSLGEIERFPKLPMEFMQHSMSLSEWRELQMTCFQRGDEIDQLTFKFIQELLLSPLMGIDLGNIGMFSKAMTGHVKDFSYTSKGVFCKFEDIPKSLKGGHDRYFSERKEDMEWTHKQNKEFLALCNFNDNIRFMFDHEYSDNGRNDGIVGGDILPPRGNFGMKGSKKGQGMVPGDGKAGARYPNAVCEDRLFRRLLDFTNAPRRRGYNPQTAQPYAPHEPGY